MKHLQGDGQPRINLLSYLQEEAAQKRELRQKLIAVVAINIMLVCAAAVSWWSQHQQVIAWEKENQHLQEQVESLRKIAAAIGSSSDQEARELSLRKSWLAKLERERTLDPGQLEEIYALSIPDITISQINMKNSGEITIKGYADNQRDLIAFLERLENEDFVKDISNVASKRNRQTGEISFTLVMAGEMTDR